YAATSSSERNGEGLRRPRSNGYGVPSKVSPKEIAAERPPRHRSVEFVDVFHGDVAVALEFESHAGQFGGKLGGDALGIGLAPPLGLAEDGLGGLPRMVDEGAAEDMGALPRHDAGVQDVSLGEGDEFPPLEDLV